MMTEPLIHTWYSLLKVLSFINQSSRVKVHDYSQARGGADYLFEEVGGENLAYMTGHGKDIAEGDYLRLKQKGQTVTYQVQAIDYYALPEEMWIAALFRKCMPQTAVH